jgi:hypothetical protein
MEDSNLLRPNNQGDSVQLPQNGSLDNMAVYPEVFCKLKPIIVIMCDTLVSSGTYPNQQDVDDISDYIYDEFCRMYPDMKEYMQYGHESGTNEVAPPLL